MCGIVGYIGERQAQPILLNCLSHLEYRGYDSCGIAVSDGAVKVYKDAVRVAELKKTMPDFDGSLGIGHTRWATHGEPSRVNAHPHGDCQNEVSVVHNGIINNFLKLKQQLTSEGHTFVSETDSEVIPHLIEKYYAGDLEKAVERALADIEGSYAIIVMGYGENTLIAARKDSPLVIALGDRENYIASDVPAVLDYTSRVIYLEDGDIATVTAGGVSFRNGGKTAKRSEHKVDWSVEEARKGGYEHYMLKEIHEQPRVIRDTLGDWLPNGEPFEDLKKMSEDGTRTLLMLGCGTSYHAALVGKYIAQEMLGLPVRAELASEFNYHGRALPETLAVTLTQSGETADVLMAIKRLKDVGCRVMAITNVNGSSVSRLADHTIITRAGPEISVAATKSFLAQLMVLYWLMMSCARVEPKRQAEMVLQLRHMASRVTQVLDSEAEIAERAGYLAKYNDVFFIGRGINYPVALEGALKLKEISYVHAEGFAAGELKHGPFALLGREKPVIAVLTQDATHQTMLTSIREVKARGSPLMVLASEGDDSADSLADFTITVPRVDPLFSPVVNTVTLQLLAYHIARKRGCPVDFPKNLAKSVTVE
ncbi:MAG: glutamine--fructose-6-phosphate transaminase (isomerizing) [Dehalococcoidia bacterium]|jgi:glucosamine--fructose-6-phosphate aminotransferase (isomerizing)|nr:MAG: glutamine--fructose-6-phosphate transaminase (isomerizing) [Dehalococcoidia bacterium]